MTLIRLWPLLVPVTWLISGLWSFPYPAPNAPFSDLTISHYTNAIFLRRAINEYHTIPFWAPTILSGYPFAANPLSGLWYPPGWLALVLPLPFGFNILVLLHLIWGGIGAYRLLRSEGLGHVAALFGGLVFESFSKWFAHYGAGHLTLIYGVSWTPWLLLSERRYTARSTCSKTGQLWDRIFIPGVILALIFLADPRWAAYSAIVWLVYAILRHQNYLELIKQSLIAGLLSMPLAVPLLEYTRLATRANLKTGDVFVFSLPPARLLGLIFPDMGGYQEWVLYPGAIVIILTLLAILWSSFSEDGKFWIGVSLTVLLFSLGSNIPLLPALGKLPGLRLLRVPSRGLFLFGLALAALSASSVEHLLAEVSIRDRQRARVLITGLAGFTSALAGGVWVLTGALSLSFAWGTTAILAGTVWIIIRLSDRMPKQMWLIGLVTFSLLDWSGVNISMFAPRNKDLVLSEQERVANYLSEQSGEYRIYSPSYSVPQHIAAIHRLQLADGVDPLHLSTYSDFLAKASGVPRIGYSVTIPPFEDGDPSTSNSRYLPNLELLGLLNVRYIASAYKINVEGLVLLKRIDDTWVYQNLKAYPRAWVQPSHSDRGSDVAPVEIVSHAPNRIEIRAAGPGLLVLSEIAYPGWRVEADGQPEDMKIAHGLLRGVNLEEGTHRVVFYYRPLSLYLGLVGWFIGLAAIVIEARNRKSTDGSR